MSKMGIAVLLSILALSGGGLAVAHHPEGSSNEDHPSWKSFYETEWDAVIDADQYYDQCLDEGFSQADCNKWAHDYYHAAWNWRARERAHAKGEKVTRVPEPGKNKPFVAAIGNPYMAAGYPGVTPSGVNPWCPGGGMTET